VAYDLETAECGAVRCQTAAPTDDGSVGLSKTAVHDVVACPVERGSLVAAQAVTKPNTRVLMVEMVPAALGGHLPVISHAVGGDLSPDLASAGGYPLDKVEGMVIGAHGTVSIVPDNDGVDDTAVKTMFRSVSVWSPGKCAVHGAAHNPPGPPRCFTRHVGPRPRDRGLRGGR
jgi:hypothetical protein